MSSDKRRTRQSPGAKLIVLCCLVLAAASFATGAGGRNSSSNTWNVAVSAGGRPVVPCTFANGYQQGPSSALTPAGSVISLHVENTRGRADCRFRATLALSLLGASTRAVLPVRGNPAPLRTVDHIVPRGTVLRISWLWRNWCRRPLTAVGDLAKGKFAVTQRWVSLFHSPVCADSQRPSTLVTYGLRILG